MKKILHGLLLMSPLVVGASSLTVASNIPPNLKEFVDANGEIVGAVVYGNARTRSYVKEIKPGVPMEIIQDVVWEGEKIYKTKNGSCLQEVRSGLSVKDNKTPLGIVQLPSYERSLLGIKCP
ncbi:hypothetical protein HA052_04330 [Chromobacterium haemolyticum]|uniref:Uncharacterized protein n=1 Tax=Chromobacterium fluminis TaxID=3044269 RepID=A0ABX0KXZ2_9NEIS|nr:hypothetical protein [Chromobacterium haemolyticum]NHR04417.1 hypothetical protein [Chromobacterium haemolyticum]